MGITEIERYLNVSRSKSVCVDISAMDEYPGYIRTTTIYPGFVVNIEYDIYDMDEGGFCFYCKSDSLQEIVEILEEYFGKPVSEWRNFSKTGEYPVLPENCDFSVGHKKIREALSDKSILLPEKGDFRMRKDSYWSEFV